MTPDSLPGYRGTKGQNFFENDALLKRALKKALPSGEQEKVFRRLFAFGALCGGTLGELIETAHRPPNLPKLRRFDAVGNRVEQVDYCLEQKEVRRIFAEAVYSPLRPGFIERMTLSYLANQCGEGGITCPFAMTEGLIGLLEKRGTPEQKRRHLPLMRSTDPELALGGGQFITERQGGSNVAANETVARRAADGSWELTGLKWFCSNPAELWVATAKVEGTNTVGLFLFPRKLPDGTLNNHQLLRLKEICGTKGKVTAEVEFKAGKAELIGRASQGLAILVREILWVSRIHSACASLGYLRRALMEAEAFAAHRVAYGRKIAEIPQVARTLKRLRETHEASLLAFYECLSCIEAGAPAEEALVPLLKIELSKRSSAAIHDAQLLIGGHGILEDFTILPRLANDSTVNEIWEGTHPILAEHTAKALRRPAVLADVERLCGGAAELRERVEANRSMSEDERSLDNLELCSFAFESVASGLALPHR